MIDNRKQQSPSSSACCSTGHNISFGDESSFGASVNILEELEVDDDALSQSIDSAIIEDDQTENTIDESEYGEGSATSMLETKCVGDNFKMLVTVLAILVTNILYLLALASGINIQKMSPRS